MAKKRRSAKQKAATRKLIRFNKSKKKKKAPKRRKSPTKRRKSSSPKKKTIKKKSSTKKSMVSRKGLGKITSNPTLRKVLMAAGAVSIATSVAVLAAPSLVPTLQKPIVRAGLGFVAGDFIGAATNFVLANGLTRNGNGNGGSQAINGNGGNGFA